MAEQIEAAALVEAVADFLAAVEPGLKGQQAFHAKVAKNALAIVARELAQRPQTTEQHLLAAFLGHEGSLDGMRAELCGRLRAGQITPDTPGLLETLQEVAMAKLAVDNPRYSTFRRLIG